MKWMFARQLFFFDKSEKCGQIWGTACGESVNFRGSGIRGLMIKDNYKMKDNYIIHHKPLIFLNLTKQNFLCISTN